MSPTPVLPDGLPKLPRDYVYLGAGGTFKPLLRFFEGIVFDPELQTRWKGPTTLRGTRETYHYAEHEDSEIARLNFGEPEPNPDHVTFMELLEELREHGFELCREEPGYDWNEWRPVAQQELPEILKNHIT